MLLHPPGVRSVFPLITLLLTVMGCDSPTNQPGVPLAQRTFEPDFNASPEPTACETSVSQVLELTRSYRDDAKSFRKDCPEGTDCLSEGAVANASFNLLTNAHAGLLFACTPGSPEVCDGLDNDKDHSVDEDFPDKGNACTLGIGACEAEGIKVCSTDGSGTVCNAVAGTPSFEICDGRDNDCNGAVDETFDIGQMCAVGVGLCMRIGTKVCSVDGVGTVCSAQPGPPGTEVCDGLDNDCDGVVDEGC